MKKIKEDKREKMSVSEQIRKWTITITLEKKLMVEEKWEVPQKFKMDDRGKGRPWEGDSNDPCLQLGT